MQNSKYHYSEISGKGRLVNTTGKKLISMVRILLIFSMACLVFSCEKPIYEFQAQNFIKFFGSGYESQGNDVAQLPDGNYVMTGTDKVNSLDYQIYTAKVDLNGNLIWSNTFGTTGTREEGKIVKIMADGYLFAGNKLTTGNQYRPFLFKTNEYGDSLWYKEFGDATISIQLEDIAVSESGIYVAGHSNQISTGGGGFNALSDYYTAKLDLNGLIEWERVFFKSSGSAFKRLFLHGEEIHFIGTDEDQDRVSIVTSLQNSGIPVDFKSIGDDDLLVADAALDESGQLFILTNTNSMTSVIKIGVDMEIDWQSESINSVTGKTLALNTDGSLMVFGEATEEGNTIIRTIRIDQNGSTEFGSSVFRDVQGSVMKAVQTSDLGIILIGSTNATFGTNVQLIKTDKDYFMFKN